MAVSEHFMNGIKSGDANARFGAGQSAWQQGPETLAPLAEVMASDNAEIAKSAREAAEAIVHHAARPGHPEQAKNAAAELLKIASDKQRPKLVRGHALELLGFVAAPPHVGAIAPLLSDPDVREDARMALERIPGDESLQAIGAAASSAPAEFKPNLEQSIQNRKATKESIGTARSFASTQPSEASAAQ